MTFVEQLTIFLIILLFAKDLAIPFMRKKGWINGNEKKDIQELKTQIGDLSENHLHEIVEKLDKLTERMIEHNAKEIALLEEIKSKL